MNLKSFTKENLLSVAASLILFASVPVVLAWTSPQVAPPNGNVPAPINVGGVYQIKQGKIGLFDPGAALRVSPDDTYVPNPNDPNNKISSLLVGANGKVGAREYCDEMGNNCISLRNINNNNNTIIINNNSTTTQACNQTYKTFPFNYSASNNQVGTRYINLPAGSYKITGSGSVTIDNGAFIWVSKNGKYDANKINLYTASVTIKYSGKTATKVYNRNWTIDPAKGTFTLTQPERIKIGFSEATIQGMLIIEGPESFVCSNTTITNS